MIARMNGEVHYHVPESSSTPCKKLTIRYIYAPSIYSVLRYQHHWI